MELQLHSSNVSSLHTYHINGHVPSITWCPYLLHHIGDVVTRMWMRPLECDNEADVGPDHWSQAPLCVHSPMGWPLTCAILNTPQYGGGDLNWTLASTCFCTLSCLCNLMTIKTKHRSCVCNESQDTRIFTNIFVHIFDCVNPTALTIELTFWCHFTPKMPNLVDFPSYCIN